MLMAFPHLFPASTNQWKPNVERDPGRDTYASPDLFTNYADFYARAAAAAKTAYRASRAQQDGDFKTYVAELRGACDSCHGLYLKSDQYPQRSHAAQQDEARRFQDITVLDNKNPVYASRRLLSDDL